VPQKLVNTVESPVRYPAVLHQALEVCLRSQGVWVAVIRFDTEREARSFYKKLNTFSRSWTAFPSYYPEMTRAVAGKKISGRVVGGEVQMRVTQRPEASWENIL
jgi:hypothetical protein